LEFRHGAPTNRHQWIPFVRLSGNQLRTNRFDVEFHAAGFSEL
jgi:hypothetical protein